MNQGYFMYQGYQRLNSSRKIGLFGQGKKAFNLFEDNSDEIEDQFLNSEEIEEQFLNSEEPFFLDGQHRNLTVDFFENGTTHKGEQE